MASKLKLTELLYPTSTTPAITINADDTVTFGAPTTTITNLSATNLAYTGTLTGGTGVVNIGSGQVYKDASGNVGIGTASPATTLQVTGDITQTWAASMDRFVGSKFSTSYELGLHFIESSRETRIVSKAADSTGLISFYTGVTPTEKMRISAAGNVGIGTISNLASSKLDVRGRIRTGSGNSSGDAEVIWSNYASATTAWNISVRQDVGGANNDLKFLRFDSSGAYQGIAMQIDSAFGNVGIGTSSPVAGLHVATPTRSISLCPPAAGLGGPSYFLMGNSDSGGASGPVVIVSANRALQFGVGNSFSSASGGTFSEFGRFDSSGNLLVGTTTDTIGRLVVKSKNTAYGGIQLVASGTSDYWTQNVDGLAGYTWGKNGADFWHAGRSGSNNCVSVNGSWVNSSDERLKKNIKTLTSALEKITAMRGVEFDRKNNDAHEIGLIAQEVLLVYPEAVEKDGDILGLNYGSLVGPLIEAIKEQQALIADLTTRLTALEGN